MKLTLDDDTARMSADLMRLFKSAVADEISSYFRSSDQINWSAVTTALMVVSADTNNTVALDYDEALQCFIQYMNGRHCTSSSELNISRLKYEAKKGSAEAQSSLGFIYEHGLDVNQDYDEARKWYLLAAEQGNADAMNQLGGMFVQGLGVAQDYNAAIKWARLAAEQGNAKGQYNFGMMYSKRLGMPEYMEEAVKWWTLAAEQGLANAQHNLGWQYVAGIGIKQDYAKALHWYHQAAAQGFLDSQNNLGEMYLNGQGVPIDLVQAHMWFSLAARNGDADALQSIEDIEKELTHEQITVAHDMKLEWLKFRPKLAQ